MKFKFVQWILFLPLLTVLLNSCVPEEFTTTGFKMDTFNPEYAIPLIDDDLSIDDILKSSNSFIKKYDDGAMSIVYRGQMFSSTAGEAVELPNQTFTQSLTLDAAQAAALSSGTDQSISIPLSETFAIGSMEIDSILFKVGNFMASISSEIKTDGEVNISIEDCRLLGNSLQLKVPFTYGGSLPVVASATKAMAGFLWNMTEGGMGYNFVKIKLDIMLKGTAQSVDAGEKMTIDLGFSTMKFAKFYGYIGKINLLNGGDTIDMTIFDKGGSGQFTLGNPKVKIICGNSFGVPVKAGFTKLSGITSGTATTVNPLPDPLPVPTPNISEMGKLIYDSVTLDKNNSNIKTVINTQPKQVFFQTYIELNPNGKTQRNFVTEYSQIKFIVDVELPLDGSAKDYVFEEVTDVGFEMPKADVIENITLRFAGNNGYPITLGTQVYLLDSTGFTFDSLFSAPDYKFLAGAPVGTDGKVTGRTATNTDIVFTALRAQRLSRLKKIKLKAGLSTTSVGGTYPEVKIFSNYVLNIKIGMMAKLNINSEFFDSLTNK